MIKVGKELDISLLGGQNALVFDVSDFTQNATKVFDAALTDEVIVNNKNGKSYRIIPINDDKKEKSPLEDIPYVTADITTQEIVDLVRENRAGV